MLLKPAIKFRPLGDQTEPRMTAHDIVCIHTMVGFLSSTDEMFRRNGYGGTESHYGIGGKWGKGDQLQRLDGVIYGWQDLAHAADANLDGNPRVISIETADNAPKFPRDIEEWTPAQIDSIVLLVAWLCTPEAHASCPSSWTCHREGIPPFLVPDSKPSRRGIAYHQQGCTPNVVRGGELWSSADGKECPGPRRIRQISTTIIPRVQALLASSEGSDMLTDDDVKKLLTSPIDAKFTDKPGDVVTVGDALGLAQRWALHGALRSQQIEATVTELAAKFGQLSAENAQLRTDIAALKSSIDQLLSRP